MNPKKRIKKEILLMLYKDSIVDIAHYLTTLEERLEKVEGVGRKSFCGTCLEGNDGVYRCIVPGCPNKNPTERRGNSNLRTIADGTCNCRPFMGGCFFTDGFDGRCDCKCHTPTPTEVKDWEREFDLRKKNWQTDFKFWESDIKSFIRNLLGDNG
jgi:hypothetical protein